MLQFKKTNNIVGWVVFAVATATYMLTLEPTASFWDCGEFIAASYKLQVPHPPGTPFFLLINKMFSLFAMGDVSKVAFWVNVSSGLCSSFSILFLFWSITLLGLKFYPNTESKDLTTYQTLSLMGAGAIGALAYTFSDSFWFSAVEAEVYAMSSFMISLILWAMLKWERIADEVLSNKYLVFIAYIIGLSIGVHPLNFLAIPVLTLTYLYKKHKNITLKNTIFALAIGAAMILVLLWIVPGIPTLAGSLEVFFVNSIGLLFNSGVIFLALLLIGAVVWGIVYSIHTKKVNLNVAFVSLAYIFLGYASYGIIIIRTQYNPPINENNPSNIVNLIYYLNREQYGTRPLISGNDFTQYPESYEKVKPLYRKDEKAGKYVIFDYKLEKKYSSEDRMMLFPRLHATEPFQVEGYKNYLGLKEGEKPTFGDNLKFFFGHQLGHMYWRYFFWNFVGREGDEQGSGVLNPFESKSDVPDKIAKNKARNQYFALPLILGLIGVGFSFMRNQRVFLLLSTLFVLTGVAMIVYFNSPPSEPRERDYIYVGSFYAFAMWIGFGVLAFADFLKKYLPKGNTSVILATTVSLVVPAIMAIENWDDHDRSKRYYSVDAAKNILSSCEPNSILFTGGDNDTFPLWYVQEVEGFRTDVRVCNTSLLGTDWYVEQMKRKAYDSDALPISFEEPQYRSGVNDQIDVYGSPLLSEEQNKKVAETGIDLLRYLDLVRANDAFVKVPLRDGDSMTVMPSQILVIPQKKQEIAKLSFLPAGADSLAEDAIMFKLPMKRFTKTELIMLDILAQNAKNGWKRPVYFSNTLGGGKNFLGLDEYLQQEGLAYRIMPIRLGIRTKDDFMYYVNTEKTYNIMLKQEKESFKGKEIVKQMAWRNLQDPKVYYHEDTYGSMVFGSRKAYYNLAVQLLMEGKKEKAKEVVNYCMKVLPFEVFPPDIWTTQMITLFLEAGDTKKAIEIADQTVKQADQMLDYLLTNEPNSEREISNYFMQLRMVAADMENAKIPEIKKYKDLVVKYQPKK
jgi:hypothetical protein